MELELECPFCKGTEFKKEEGRIARRISFKNEDGTMDSSWDLTAHKINLFICENCNYIMQFSDVEQS